MDDLQIIDCVEKIRGYVEAADGAISARFAELGSNTFEDKPNAYFKARLVAIVHGIDDSAPAGRRKLRAALHHGRHARHFEENELAAISLAEATGDYGSKDVAENERLALSLEAFERLSSPGDDNTFSHHLGKCAGLSEAAKFVGKTLPALRGNKVYEYLADIGYPSAIPAAETARLLHRLDLLEKPSVATTAARRGFFSRLEYIARAAEISLSQADFLLAAYAGGRTSTVEPICVSSPRCERCTLTPHCAFFKHRAAPQKRQTVTIKQWAHNERPREKLLAGDRLSDAELLAIILRTGTGSMTVVDLARELLRKFETLHRLEAATPAEIQKGVKGIGPAKAAEIKAAIELGRRVTAPESDERESQPRIESSRDVFDLYRAQFKTATQEEFFLLALNIKNRIIRKCSISTGTLNASIVHPRDAFKHALAESAASVVFVHNHPSGDPEPSSEDRALTNRLADAGKLLGVRVLDHVIIGANRYYSFADQGELR